MQRQAAGLDSDVTHHLERSPLHHGPHIGMPCDQFDIESATHGHRVIQLIGSDTTGELTDDRDESAPSIGSKSHARSCWQCDL